LSGDLGFANAAAEKFTDLICMQGSGNGAAQALAVLPGVSQACTNPFAQDLAFELGEDGE
jgi:undecaprenyl pyrophosphate phosphatase UppP